jgi:hypothetical protein
MVRTATGFTRGPKFCWMHYLEPLFMTLFVNPAAAAAAFARRSLEQSAGPR